MFGHQENVSGFKKTYLQYYHLSFIITASMSIIFKYVKNMNIMHFICIRHLFILLITYLSFTNMRSNLVYNNIAKDAAEILTSKEEGRKPVLANK